MTDVERVKGFGKTLKAFQAVADQINEIADLQATEKEAERRTEKATLEFFSAMDKLIEVQDKLKEANSLKEAAYKERDTVDKSSKDNANYILSEAKSKAEDMIKNAHVAADQVRHVNEIAMSELKKQQNDLIYENEELVNTHKELQTSIDNLKKKFA